MNNVIQTNDFSDVLKKSFNHPLQQDFVRDFNVLATRMYSIQTLIEHCHRETKSEPRHEALGEAYEDFAELKDTIIEQIIGFSGKNYGNITFNPGYPEYKPEMAWMAAEMLCLLAKDIIGFAQKFDIPSVDNYGQDVFGVGAKLKYKLQLNNSDEKSSEDGVIAEEVIEKSSPVMEQTMKLFKEGKLKTSAGDTVTDRKQAIAIGLSEEENQVKKSKNKHDFSEEEREKLAEKDEALPDGSFPIRNEQDLKDAIRSVGRAKDPNRAKSWIKKRAKELNKENILPNSWK